jgi:ribosome biogenesis ATPase
LAKATPGYVGADLAALTGAAGIIAVKRIFKQLSDGTLVLPEPVESAVTNLEDVVMEEDVTPTLSPPDGPSSTTTAFSALSSQLSPGSIGHFLIAHPDPLTASQLAPLCITSHDFTLALKQVQPSSKREGFATVPDVTWGDIGALHTTREELHMSIVQPIKRPELFSAVGIEAPCGVLLWGPPGCGKTLLAKAVANESRANFISVKGPELLNKVRHPSIVISRADEYRNSMSVRVNGPSDKFSLVQELRLLASSFSTSSMHWFHGEMTIWYASSFTVLFSSGN